MRSKQRAAVTTLAAILTLLCVGVWAGVAVPTTSSQIQSVDAAWHDAMAAREWAPAVAVATALAWIGSTWVSLPACLLIGIWLWRRRGRRDGALWALATGGAQLTSMIGKWLYQRSRPDDRLMEAVDTAFPSGHATMAAVIASMLFFLFVPPCTAVADRCAVARLRARDGLEPDLPAHALAQRRDGRTAHRRVVGPLGRVAPPATVATRTAPSAEIRKSVFRRHPTNGMCRDGWRRRPCTVQGPRLPEPIPRHARRPTRSGLDEAGQ